MTVNRHLNIALAMLAPGLFANNEPSCVLYRFEYAGAGIIG
jgi:hypothetical protein